MKRLVLIYIFFGAAYSLAAALLEWFPADMIAAWGGGRETKWQFVLILCGTFLHVLIPLIVFFVVWNLMLTTRKKRIPLGEGTVVTIRRDRGLFRSLYPLEIWINGERMTIYTIWRQKTDFAGRRCI